MAEITTTHAVRSASTPHFGLALLALAMGGFTIGTTEFVTMGILPEIAEDIDRSIPTTSHIISAYALGVVIGAPLIVSVGARLPKRAFAVWLVLGLALGNLLTVLASGYLPVLGARFVAGLPHGAYFGVASLVAASIAPPDRRGRAVSMVMMGLSVATVAGVPAATWLGQLFGWRAAYAAVVVIALIAALLIRLSVPFIAANPGASIRGELAALKQSQVLFAAGTGLVGFGGIFAMYSFISPIVTDVTGLSRTSIPWFLLAFGVGSVLGTWVAGRLTDFSVEKTVMGGFIVSIFVLLIFFFVASYTIPALIGVLLVGGLGSLVAIGLQIRLMDAAGDAQMLGAALNHSSLNIANGLGAWLGSLVIIAGYGYAATSLVGATLAAAGLVVFVTGLMAGRSQP